MSFALFKDLIREGTLANRPVTPDQSDFRQAYYATDVDTLYVWSPILKTWANFNGTISNITAAGASQGNATPITTSKVVVATVSVSTHGVRLPAPSTGLEVKVINNGPTYPLEVYPSTGAIINALTSNAVDTTKLGVLKTTVYQALDAKHWVTFRGA